MSDITGQFEEASGFVRYLASDAAAFMTGQKQGVGQPYRAGTPPLSGKASL